MKQNKLLVCRKRLLDIIRIDAAHIVRDRTIHHRVRPGRLVTYQAVLRNVVTSIFDCAGYADFIFGALIDYLQFDYELFLIRNWLHELGGYASNDRNLVLPKMCIILSKNTEVERASAILNECRKRRVKTIRTFHLNLVLKSVATVRSLYEIYRSELYFWKENLVGL